jgi:hypothetical protein
MARGQEEREPIPPEVALAGILALMVDAREREIQGDKTAVRTEVLLANADLPIEHIASVAGKKYDAVRMCIQRSKGK